MSTRLYKPVQREIDVDGKAYLVTLEPGEGSNAGEVMLTLRRKGAHRGASSNLSQQVRDLTKQEFPQLPLRLEFTSRSRSA